MSEYVDKFNVDGQEYEIEPVMDNVPTQGSQRAVSSGGVYQELIATRGATPVPEGFNAVGAFTRKGAYDFFMGSKTADSWLGKIFGTVLGKSFKSVSVTLGYNEDRSTAVAYGNGIYVMAISDEGLWWSDDKVTWHRSSDYSSHVTFEDVKFANGRFVAVSGALIVYSDDGKEWSEGLSAPSGYSVYNVYFADGLWSVGAYWSEDGAHWTQAEGLMGAGRSRGVIKANGLWLTGFDANIYWSEDGKSFTACTGYSGSYYIRIIKFAEGRWVIGTQGDGLWYSTDGKAWTQSDVTTSKYESLGFINGVWLAGDLATTQGVWKSVNGGVNWTQLTGDLATSYIGEITSANGVCMLASSGKLFRTLDGSNFDTIVLNAETLNSFYSIAYANGTWITAGYNRKVYYSDVEQILNSGYFVD